MESRIGAIGGLSGDPSDKADDIDERTRFQLLAVLQYLEQKQYLEALVALQSECGLTYLEGSLPVSGVLESSLDMFGQYQEADKASGGANAEAAAVEAEIQQMERGVCCTEQLPQEQAATPTGIATNVTSVCWVDGGRGSETYMSLVATADRRIRLFGGSQSAPIAEFSDLPSPPLGLDSCTLDGGVQVLVTMMGGETVLLALKDISGGTPSFERKQSWKDHTKHVPAGKFAPGSSPSSDDVDGEEEAAPQAPATNPGLSFLTISRDHSARLYRRANWEGDFSCTGTIRLLGEVTACCWLTPEIFVLAARDDHHLLYYDVAGGSDGGPKERQKVNLNVVGDSVVSFAVLSLAASPNGKMVAACTDKSRVIVLQAYSNRQLRNLYGAVVEEYDTPTVCFSLDNTFVYCSSSLAVKAQGSDDLEERLAQVTAMCGQISIFELKSAQEVLRLPCHERAVRCMARHPQKEVLITGSFDKTAKYWG